VAVLSNGNVGVFIIVRRLSGGIPTSRHTLRRERSGVTFSDRSVDFLSSARIRQQQEGSGLHADESGEQLLLRVLTGKACLRSAFRHMTQSSSTSASRNRDLQSPKTLSPDPDENGMIDLHGYGNQQMGLSRTSSP